MRNRSTSETLRTVLESFAMDLHVAIPGVVRSYDAATQTATIEPGVQRVLSAEDEDSGEDASESLPILQGVPVLWPRAGGFFLHWPMTAGDSVLVIFSESDINAWREAGGVVDPGVGTRHGLSGGVAIPGMFTLADPLADAHATNGRVGRSSGPFVEFQAAEIQAGGDLALAEHPDLTKHLEAISDGLDAVALRLNLLEKVVAGQHGSPTIDLEIQVDYGRAAQAIVTGFYPIATTILKGT